MTTEINVCVGGCGKTGPVPPGHPMLVNFWCPECKERVMREKQQSLIACDRCGIGYPGREIANVGSMDEPEWLCKPCFDAWTDAWTDALAIALDWLTGGDDA